MKYICLFMFHMFMAFLYMFYMFRFTYCSWRGHSCSSIVQSVFDCRLSGKMIRVYIDLRNNLRVQSAQYIDGMK